MCVPCFVYSTVLMTVDNLKNNVVVVMIKFTRKTRSYDFFT